MGMAKEMIARLHVKDAIPKWCIAPMSTSRAIEYHYRWLVSHNDIRIIWNQLFRVIIAKPKELHALNLNTPVLQEIKVIRQILYALCIPQAQVMIASNEYFVAIRQLDIPVQEIQHFVLIAVMANVTTMYDDISPRQVFYLKM